MRRILFMLTVVAVSLALTGCRTAETTENIPAVRNFNLPDYLGTWYEIARLPHSFEQGIRQAQATYSLRSDGRVDVLNSGIKDGKSKKATGIAHLKGSDSEGFLRVSFFRPFYGDYKIIYLSEDYSLSIVTSGTKDYLWILARKAEISPEQMAFALDKIRAWGFKADELEYSWRPYAAKIL